MSSKTVKMVRGSETFTFVVDGEAAFVKLSVAGVKGGKTYHSSDANRTMITDVAYEYSKVGVRSVYDNLVASGYRRA